MPLTHDDYNQAAKALNCEIAAVKAVAAVESAGEPFLADGRVVILFEAHLFHRFTKGRFTPTHPNISSKTWNRKLYKGGAAEWGRLEEAKALDRTAALMSASWGIFQICGFNFAQCGFTSVESFVEALGKDERYHLEAFVEFIKANGLADELQRKDWAGFARIYNGPSYATQGYHVRMANAYSKFSAEEKAGLASTALPLKENA